MTRFSAPTGCGGAQRPRGGAREARCPWWRRSGPSVGAVQASARRSSTATAATRRDHVRSAIIAGQRPRPDFWHPTALIISERLAAAEPGNAQYRSGLDFVRRRLASLRGSDSRRDICSDPNPGAGAARSCVAEFQHRGSASAARPLVIGRLKLALRWFRRRRSARWVPRSPAIPRTGRAPARSPPMPPFVPRPTRWRASG